LRVPGAPHFRDEIERFSKIDQKIATEAPEPIISRSWYRYRLPMVE